jgi:hypothetical protein
MMESILVNKIRFTSSCGLHIEIGIGAGDFLDTVHSEGGSEDVKNETGDFCPAKVV